MTNPRSSGGGKSETHVEPYLQTLPAGLEKSSNRAHNYGLGVAVVKARGDCAFIVRFATVVWLLICHFRHPASSLLQFFLPPDGEILIAPREMPVISNRFFKKESES